VVQKVQWLSSVLHVRKSRPNILHAGNLQKKKGTQGVIEVENPNLVKIKNLKVKDVDLDRPAELSRREREEIEKQRAHERYIKLQEQGKTEQSKKDLGADPPPTIFDTY
jgi:hypothetical protein